jgi:hypothetical protein
MPYDLPYQMSKVNKYNITNTIISKFIYLQEKLHFSEDFLAIKTL